MLEANRIDWFKETNLERFRRGEETIETLERKRDFGKNSNYKKFQDVAKGIQAALDILKQSNVER